MAATLGGRIFAVDQVTGRLRWSMQTGDTLPRNVAPAGGWDLLVSSPVVVGNNVVIGGRDGVVYSLDLATGRVRWRGRTTGKIRATPAVAEGVVVVGSWDGRVYAFDLATGRERWVNRTVGDTLDSKKFGFDRRAIQGSPAIAGGQVFIGSRDGGFYGIDFKTGERQWRATHRGSWVVGSPSGGAGAGDGGQLRRTFRARGRSRDRQGHLADGHRHERARLAAPRRGPDGDRALSHRRSGRWGLGARCGDRGRAMEARSRCRGDVVPGGRGWRALTSAPKTGVSLRSRRRMPWCRGWPSSTTRRNASWRGCAGAELAFEYFKDLGYETLASDSLAGFMNARIADGVPSVVVFAMDVAPKTRAPDDRGHGAHPALSQRGRQGRVAGPAHRCRAVRLDRQPRRVRPGSHRDRAGVVVPVDGLRRVQRPSHGGRQALGPR